MTKNILILSLAFLCPQWTFPLHRGNNATIGSSITRVNAVGNASAIIVAGNVATQALGYTTVAGHFLTIQVAAQPNPDTLTSLTCGSNSSSTPLIHLQDSGVGGHVGIYLFYFPNAAACSSITTNWSGNGSYVSIASAEYSGMSATATPTATAVTYDSGYVTTASWSTGGTPYSGTAGSLIVTGTATNSNTASTFTTVTPWSIAAQAGTTGAQGPEMVLQDNVNGLAISYTGQGTWPPGTAGQYYESYIVGFK